MSGTDLHTIEGSRIAGYTLPDLIIGVGNCGRADDGLGWAFLDAVDHSDYEGQLEYRYQLQVEDAELIARVASVLIVDSTVEIHAQGFELKNVLPVPVDSFSTHSLDPGSIAYLVTHLYGRYPDMHLLAISGSEWGLHEGLSQVAKINLQKALAFVSDAFF